MNKPRTIVAISGSLRKNSSNETIVNFLKEHSEEVIVDTSLQLQNLPHFDPNLGDDELPSEVRKFNSTIEAADGIILCTPEYVFSLPGVLKNALEWTVSTTIFLDKPTAIIVAAASGDKAFESLQLIMKTIGSKLTSDTNLLIKGIKGKVKDQKIIDKSTVNQIKLLMDSLINNIS